MMYEMISSALRKNKQVRVWLAYPGRSTIATSRAEDWALALPLYLRVIMLLARAEGGEKWVLILSLACTASSRLYLISPRAAISPPFPPVVVNLRRLRPSAIAPYPLRPHGAPPTESSTTSGHPSAEKRLAPVWLRRTANIVCSPTMLSPTSVGSRGGPTWHQRRRSWVLIAVRSPLAERPPLGQISAAARKSLPLQPAARRPLRQDPASICMDNRLESSTAAPWCDPWLRLPRNAPMLKILPWTTTGM
jgi:hypothetical protein